MDDAALPSSIGRETLERIAEAKLFNQWMFQKIEPWLKGKVLEIGSGIGNISSQLLESNKFDQVELSDIEESYISILQEKFSKIPVHRINLVDPKFDESHQHLFEKFDSVFALNVIEHIKDDKLALENMSKFIKPGGHVVILVPAFQHLYNEFDKAQGHFKRYTIKSIKVLVEKNFSVLNCRYFNAVGMIGWFINGTVGKRTLISSTQLKIFNWLVPIIKITDMVFHKFCGLSVFIACKKNQPFQVIDELGDA